MTLDDTYMELDSNSPDSFPSWNELDWKEIDTQVKRLRQRIFIAARNGKRKELGNLQRLMVNSKLNILQSIRKVTSLSSGRKTPGIDSRLALLPEERMQLFHEIQNMNIRSWDPFPVLRVYIPKPDGRRRPLGIPTIKDRVLQCIVKNALEPEWESYFEPSSYGFRPGKSYQDAVHRVHTLLSKKDRVWVVDADIKGCFDNISHKYLLEKVRKFPYVDLIEKWLKAGILDQNIYTIPDTGTPQGGTISPLLCNIALDGLEKELNIIYDQQGYITRKLNPLNRTLVRFADDFVIICPSKEVAELTVSELKNLLVSRGLSLAPDKTRIVSTFDGFDFLGFNIRHILKLEYKYIYLSQDDMTSGIESAKKEFVSTLIIPSKKSISSAKKRLTEIFHQHRGKTAEKLIAKLNPVIRGYCESKRTSVFTHAARTLNHHLFQLQIAWMRRKHPKKNYSWRILKYFTHYKTFFINNRWTFKSPETGRICFQHIWFAKKKFWVPVVGSYCPDDPALQSYWKERQHKMFICKCIDLHSTLDRNLAYTQAYICPVCEQNLFEEGGTLHRHHILPTSMGGKDTANNLLLVHLHCHQRIHYGKDLHRWIFDLTAFKDKCASNKDWSYSQTLSAGKADEIFPD